MFTYHNVAANSCKAPKLSSQCMDVLAGVGGHLPSATSTYWVCKWNHPVSCSLAPSWHVNDSVCWLLACGNMFRSYHCAATSLTTSNWESRQELSGKALSCCGNLVTAFTKHTPEITAERLAGFGRRLADLLVAESYFHILESFMTAKELSIPLLDGIGSVMI